MFRKRDEGQSAVELSIVIGLICIASLLGLTAVRGAVVEQQEQLANSLIAQVSQQLNANDKTVGSTPSGPVVINGYTFESSDSLKALNAKLTSLSEELQQGTQDYV